MAIDTTDVTGTLATLVSIIDDPDFDASDEDCIRDLLQYINIHVRAVAPKVEPCES